MIGHRPVCNIPRTMAAHAFGLQQWRNISGVGNIRKARLESDAATFRYALAGGHRLSGEEIHQRI